MIRINAYEHLGELVVSVEDVYRDEDGRDARHHIGVERVSVTLAELAFYDNALMFIAETLVQLAADAHERLVTDVESSPIFP